MKRFRAFIVRSVRGRFRHQPSASPVAPPRSAGLPDFHSIPTDWLLAQRALDDRELFLLATGDAPRDMARERFLAGRIRVTTDEILRREC